MNCVGLNPMPISRPEESKVTALTTSTQGGTARGWSFISTALVCWRLWLMKYLFHLYPAKSQAHFGLGSAYHAIHEGVPEPEIAAAFPEHIVEAKRLVAVRMKDGPPLPAAVEKEVQHTILEGKMTSKPDRVESGKKVIRDFKTAANFSEWDEEIWNTDGGILGEILAVGAERALVDIVRKTKESASPTKNRTPQVKVVSVKMTPEKKRALTAIVTDFWTQLRMRMAQLEAARETAGDDPEALATAVDTAFPPNIKAGCVGRYGPCSHFDRCWGIQGQKLMFKRGTTNVFPWNEPVEGGPKRPIFPPKLLAKLKAKFAKVL